MVVNDSAEVHKIEVNKFNFSDIQAEHGDMDRKNHLTDKAARHIVEDNSVKVQEPHESHNKFKCSIFQDKYGDREARDALVSEQVGDNSTKVEDSELGVNYFESSKPY